MARSFESQVYRTLKLVNDVKAVKNGRVPRRIGRRIYGKITGRIARRIFG